MGKRGPKVKDETKRRKSKNVSFDNDLIARIDRARRHESFSSFCRRMILFGMDCAEQKNQDQE